MLILSSNSATPTNANLTRARPYAYIIPPFLANLTERIEGLGIPTETLSKSRKAKVEILKITSIVEKPASGATSLLTTVTSVTTRTSSKEVMVPKGSIIVRTDTKNAALAFVALEVRLLCYVSLQC